MEKEINNLSDIFNDEDVELLSEAFKQGDKRLVKDIIHDLGFLIGIEYYPTPNIFLWPFRNYRTRGAWITKIITKRDYEALVNGVYVSDNENPEKHITKEQAKGFLEKYRDKFGHEWELLSGWEKFWITLEGETGVRLVKKKGNPISNVRKISKLLSP